MTESAVRPCSAVARPTRRAARAVALAAFAAGLLAAALRPDASAASASAAIEVADDAGRALADVAVWLEPVDGKAPATPPRPATIAQADKRFQPRMSIVQAGSSVSFPNEDTVRHHVYSFSPAKPFELKLYIGTPAAPVVFDRAGTVVLGCNIHDRMVGWVQVVDTPWFGRSDDAGRVRIGPLPPGEYRLRAFHPEQRAALPEQRVRVAADSERLALRIALKREAARP